MLNYGLHPIIQGFILKWRVVSEPGGLHPDLWVAFKKIAGFILKWRVASFPKKISYVYVNNKFHPEVWIASKNEVCILI